MGVITPTSSVGATLVVARSNSQPATKPLPNAKPQTYRNEVAVTPAKAGVYGWVVQGRGPICPPLPSWDRVGVRILP